MPENTLDPNLPTHPRTGDRALGLRDDGRPIWPIRGGSGEGDDRSTTSQQTTVEPAAPETKQQAEQSEPPQQGSGEQQKLDDAKQHDEIAVERDQLREALDAVRTALDPDAMQDTAPDPAELAAAVATRDAQLADLATQLRTAQVELAAYQTASQQGARADRLLNSRSFVSELAALDPADAKFGDQLADAITRAVAADPELYRAAAAPGRGGAEFNGPPKAESRPASLHEAITAHLGG